ncbi:MAG: hypothetical protein PHD82_03220 [Candidatus Riflebacteria bacterium]|nr:hypothetical protein [Candidatus Riflebacteria bacterium]
MFDQRVALLSDYAGQYMQKGQEIETGGFWKQMIGLFGASKVRPRVSGFQGKLDSTEFLIDEGFAPFCKIDDRYIHIKKNQEECQIAISEGGKVWDLTDWGEDYIFITRFIAECYFMITRDDFHIDDDERSVFRALVGCIEANSNEIIDARNIVYWTLVEKVVEDGVVTEEELSTMAKIRSELEIDSHDVQTLHNKALNDYYDLVRQKYEEESDGFDELEKIQEMARLLNVPLRNSSGR